MSLAKVKEIYDDEDYKEIDRRMIELYKKLDPNQAPNLLTALVQAASLHFSYTSLTYDYEESKKQVRLSNVRKFAKVRGEVTDERHRRVKITGIERPADEPHGYYVVEFTDGEYNGLPAMYLATELEIEN